MDEQIIIDVQVDAQKAEDALAQATLSVERLKNEQKQLTQQYRDGEIDVRKYAVAMADNKAQLEAAQRAVKSNTAVLQVAGKQVTDNTKSLDEQRQMLNTLQKAYASLSGEDKKAADAAGGLRDQIKALSDSLKEQESAIGDNRRNVGNYAESITGAIKGLGDFGDVMSKNLSAMEKTNPAVSGLADGFKSFDTIAKAFAKNPVLGVLQVLWEVLKGNKDAMEIVKKAISALAEGFKMIMPYIETFAKYLVSGVLTAIKGVATGIEWLLRQVDKLAARFGKQTHLADGFHEFTEELKLNADAALVDADAQKKLAEQMAEVWWESVQVKQILASVSSETGNYTAEVKKLRQELEHLVQAERDAQAAEEAGEADQQVARFKARQDALVKLRLTAVKTAEAAELDAARIAYKQGLITREEYEEAQTKIHEHYTQVRLSQTADELSAWGNKALDTIEAVSNAMAASENAELARYKKQQDDKKKALDARLQRGMISEKEYNAQVQSIEAQTAKKEMELQDKQAKRDKALGIMQATINTAAAIMKIWAEVPKADWGVGTAILTALAAATGAAQVATIAAQPLPSQQAFAEGGIVAGTSYTGDKVQVRANSGEMVITQAQQARLFNIANGSAPAVGVDYERMAAAMAAAVASQPAPVMVYSEYNDFKHQVATYQELATL